MQSALANDKADAIRVAATDTVAVALKALPAGASSAAFPDLPVRADIPAGHKFALAPIRAGEAVVKYGWSIGRATVDIAPGDWVHEHNLETGLSGELAYEWRPDNACPQAAAPDVFMGYRRADGRVGVRNEIWIIPTVGCVAKASEIIAQRASVMAQGKVDGVVALVHPFGCSQLGDDLAGTRAILAALAGHPNAGGVLFMGLGCESNQLDPLVALAGLDPARVRTVRAQGEADEIETGLAAVGELIAQAAQDQRTPCPASDLVIGVKCGGSDGLSGLTANPLVGDMTDRVTGQGGSALLTEIPEIFGAEHLLMQRCDDADAFEALVGVVNDFKRYFLDLNQPVYENPSPGNRRGGITTLEEKSLGAVQKAGQARVIDVIRYGARRRRTGLTVLEAPGNDAVSTTALTAAGATIVLFTTGRGTPLGCPAPTLKIASNSDLAARKPAWIDFNAGQVVEGVTRAEAASALWSLILDTASGAQTCAERRGEQSIAIWKTGVTL